MLDTIRVKYPIAPTDEQLLHWSKTTTETPTGIRKKYYYNYELDEVMLKFTYLPADYTGKPLLSLELSLPKLLFGNNYQMILGVKSTIEMGNYLLKDIPHVPTLDLAEGILIRLDMCCNYQVGDLVDDYIKALGYLDYPHRRTKYHRQEGVEFKAKHKTLKFYNKERESRRQEAAGILRQEITLMNPKDIQKLVDTKTPRLTDITKEFVIEQLENDLAKLRLLGNSILTYEKARKELCHAHGELAGMYYYAFLISKMDNSKKEIAADTKLHPRSIDRKLRKVVDVGIPLTLTEKDEPLPPLEIKL
ncbi:MAG: hypothetical protein HN736_09060 [Anaerolineae bacterium]|jgi:hypothetical protein|nr:hypothetical protein [Anaerolineae bacterium]MBT3714517.1 hypothetical protein [Anaerolineae bacterium]MBT4308913.1 hypothetical protein [Anaerolineae bacterium]MBT4459064.1 hypothetical protein [Anaerolineae bacterium]MBT6061223.1 hypothetical protein [Anaerolineae bacterium]